ncbi:hypothetical protein ACIQU1_23040 [Streptomyces angustmyceticus]|uniref:hypothetical protein n=1 Tax=Streptomyces angustmyceticus TaxID=285578 RepID=UPI00345031F2
MPYSARNNGGEMSDRFNLHGLRRDNLDEAKRLISDTLGVEFTPKESSFRGGAYFSHRGSDRFEVTIERNFTDDEGILSEPEFPLHSTLIFVSYATSEVEGLLNALGEIDLLRSEVIQ